MSVMQRKLFANKEARTKLRDMGGIMSSFPELSGEVQRFQAGGGVTPEFIPPVPSAYDQLRSETPEFREVDPNATAFMQDVQGLLRQGEIAKALRRVQVGLATGSYGPAGSLGGRVLGYFSDDPETAAQRAAGREAMQWLNDPANERMLLENPDLILLAAEDPISFVARAGSGQMIADLARKDAEAVAEERAAAGVTSAKDSFGARLARGDQEPGMTTGTPIYEQRIASLVPTSAETPDETGDEEQAAPTTEQRIASLIPTPTETGDETGGDGTGTRDLRARAEERIKLFQDLFGSDEPTARDRAMQFAMIGLAIAAGQSPNALTNIASGLLAGTQAMTAQEAERRKGAREIRSEAITSVFDELAEERKLTREQREKLLSQQEEIATMWQSVYQEARKDAITTGVTDPEAANIYATKAANAWAQTRYPDLYPEGGQEPLFTAPPLAPDERQRIGQDIIERLRKENRSDAEIARLMRQVDIDPAEFGITDG